jgi:hypothetical protein
MNCNAIAGNVALKSKRPPAPSDVDNIRIKGRKKLSIFFNQRLKKNA